MKTRESRQLTGGTGALWISKDGLVDRGCESQVPRAVSPASPLTYTGRIKCNQMRSGDWGSILWLFSKSRQESRFQRPLSASREQWAALIHHNYIKGLLWVLEGGDQGCVLTETAWVPDPAHHLLAVKPQANGHITPL